MGGFTGVLVIGIRRAVFSNEAGVGSASIAHSAAKTEYPVREGIVALLEPFIDTIVVCTMTGLVIVITGAYADPNNYDVIASLRGRRAHGPGDGRGGQLVPLGADRRGRAVRLLDDDLVVVLRRALLRVPVRRPGVDDLQDHLRGVRVPRLDHHGQQHPRLRRPDDPVDGPAQHPRAVPALGRGQAPARRATWTRCAAVGCRASTRPKPSRTSPREPSSSRCASTSRASGCAG